MLALIILVVFGLGMAFFATQNTNLASIRIGNYLISAVPMYIIVILSLLLGFFISFLISLADRITAYFAIHGKDSALQNASKTIANLEKEKQRLEIEIARLKGQKIEEITSPHDEHITRPSFLSRLKHSFGY